MKPEISVTINPDGTVETSGFTGTSCADAKRLAAWLGGGVKTERPEPQARPQGAAVPQGGAR